MEAKLNGLRKLPFLKGFSEESLQLLASTMSPIVGKAPKDAFYVQEGTARLGSLIAEPGDWANIATLVNLKVSFSDHSIVWSAK